MKKRYSYYKHPEKDKKFLEDWVKKLETLNGYTYERTTVETALGTTQIWGLNWNHPEWDTLVIFPGTRTSSLFWDFDQGLKHLNGQYRIFMVETNGQPNLSDGNSPDIKSLNYGHWAAEVFTALNIEKAFITGASFGAIVCMKLCITNPEKVQAAVLLNPGCFRFISLSWKNLYANLLPIFSTTEKNVAAFLDKVVFFKPHHSLSAEAEQLLIDYEVHAIGNYKDRTQKPYNMGDQLKQVTIPTYIIHGKNDILIPYEKSMRNAKTTLQDNLREAVLIENAGHGTETLDRAILKLGDFLKRELS